MQPKKIWANLGVEDLERTTQFYTALGLKSNGRSKELTSFFFGEDQFIVHFFLKNILQTNMNIQMADLKNGNEIMFTLSAESKEQVNTWQQEVERAGGTILSKAEEFGQGYYGFTFADPDGHAFNVFYM